MEHSTNCITTSNSVEGSYLAPKHKVCGPVVQKIERKKRNQERYQRRLFKKEESLDKMNHLLSTVLVKLDEVSLKNEKLTKLVEKFDEKISDKITTIEKSKISELIDEKSEINLLNEALIFFLTEIIQKYTNYHIRLIGSSCFFKIKQNFRMVVKRDGEYVTRDLDFVGHRKNIINLQKQLCKFGYLDYSKKPDSKYGVLFKSRGIICIEKGILHFGRVNPDNKTFTQFESIFTNYLNFIGVKYPSISIDFVSIQRNSDISETLTRWPVTDHSRCYCVYKIDLYYRENVLSETEIICKEFKSVTNKLNLKARTLANVVEAMKFSIRSNDDSVSAPLDKLTYLDNCSNRNLYGNTPFGKQRRRELLNMGYAINYLDFTGGFKFWIKKDLLDSLDGVDKYKILDDLVKSKSDNAWEKEQKTVQKKKELSKLMTNIKETTCCPICMSTINDDNNIMIAPCCLNIFCIKCLSSQIIKYLCMRLNRLSNGSDEITTNTNNCPICRNEFCNIEHFDANMIGNIQIGINDMRLSHNFCKLFKFY